MSKKSAKIAALIESCQGQRLDAHYLGFFLCFNEQLFYEAHDVLADDKVIQKARRMPLRDGVPRHGDAKREKNSPKPRKLTQRLDASRPDQKRDDRKAEKNHAAAPQSTPSRPAGVSPATG